MFCPLHAHPQPVLQVSVLGWALCTLPRCCPAGGLHLSHYVAFLDFLAAGCCDVVAV